MTEKIWNRLFIYAFTANLMLHLCTNMTVTLTAVYADHLGAAETVVGLATSLFALSALFSKIVAAPSIDTFNRKNVLLLSTGIMAVSYVCYSLTRNVPMLLVSRLLQGAGQAFTTTCCLAIASDSLPSDKMSTGIGYFALTTAIAQAISPAIGLKMVETIGYNLTFAALAVIAVSTMVFIANMKIPFIRSGKFRVTLDNVIAKECAVPAAILMLLCMSYFVVPSFLVLFAGQRGVGSNIGLFFTVNAVSLLFTRPLIGRLSDKLGSVKVLIPSMLCYALSFLLISWCRTLPAFLAAGFVSAFGFGGCQPALQAAALKNVPKERRGAASCTCYIGNDIGVLIGPVLAGAVAEMSGYVVMWRVMIAPILVAMLVCFIFRSSIAGKKTDAVV